MEAEPNMYKGDWERVVEAAETGVPVAREIGNWLVANYASAWAAIAYLKLGRPEDARHILFYGFNEEYECLLREEHFFVSRD